MLVCDELDGCGNETLQMLVPAVSCLVSVLSAISTLTLEVRRFLCGLFTVTLACVIFFGFLATLLALAAFAILLHPFPGQGVDFHRIIIMCVRV